MDTEEKREFELWAQDQVEKSRKFLDNALLKICSLGVPLSILFLNRQGFDKAECQWLFDLFLVAWLVTVGSVIASYKINAHKWYYYDFSKSKSEQGVKSLCITCLNWTSLVSFGIGLFGIIVFAIVNRQLF